MWFSHSLVHTHTRPHTISQALIDPCNVLFPCFLWIVRQLIHTPHKSTLMCLFIWNKNLLRWTFLCFSWSWRNKWCMQYHLQWYWPGKQRLGNPTNFIQLDYQLIGLQVGSRVCVNKHPPNWSVLEQDTESLLFYSWPSNLTYLAQGW